jgi:Domain of unknown function (DUF4192)
VTRRRGARLPHAETITRLRLREPVDVLAAVPYVVGYHPADSIVVIGLVGRQLLFAARDDLPSAGCPPERIGAVVRQLHDVVTYHRVTGILLVGYGVAERVDPVADGLRHACDGSGVAVLEMLRATGGRYWSYLCHDPACCPVEGTAFDVSCTTVAAQATVSGRVALADRAEYERQIAPIGDGVATAQATDRADARLLTLIRDAPDESAAAALLVDVGRAALATALRRHREGGWLEDDEVAWLSVLVATAEVRDLAWDQVQGRGPVDAHRALWMDVMRRATPDLVAAPATLYAFCAWCCGDSTLARLALARVLDHTPDYTVAQLLDRLLARGLPPWALDGRDLTREPGRRPRRRSSSRRAGNRRE